MWASESALPVTTTPRELPLLLICDHRGERIQEFATRALMGGYRLRVSHSLRESLQALAEEPPEMILLDPLSQGGSVELEALESARGDPLPAPLLILCDADRPEAALGAARALRRGAWDLIHRSAPPEELRVRVDRLSGERETLQAVEELKHRASHDDRTDLLRPNAFQERLVEHFSAAQRHGLNLALVLIDLDHFGRINKDHDHTVGDRLIGSVGDVIRRAVRTEDVAARLGGDEFAVLLPFTRKIHVVAVVNRLRDEIGGLSGTPLGARGPIAVSASIGFETFDGTDLDSLAALRAHAERALRVAKEGGGNQSVYFRGIERRREDEPDEDDLGL